MRLDGLHHVSAITADVDANFDCNGQLRGLRLIWQGVVAQAARDQERGGRRAAGD